MKLHLFNQSRAIYDDMLKTINEAKKSIFLQTYIYSNDCIGTEFAEALSKKAKEGVSVHLLIDAWGAVKVTDKFFKELKRSGGKVSFFRPIKLRFDLKNLRRNHKRNHRKILVIDERISYVGSINIMESSIGWKEYVAKINDSFLSKKLKMMIEHDEKMKDRYYNKKRFIEKITYKDSEIIEDTPSLRHNQIRAKYLELINGARQSIVIENSYFLPITAIRRALRRARKRGVRVVIIQPKNSDVKVFDIARQFLFGRYYKNKFEMYFYSKSVLHSKIMVVDSLHLIIGSTNLDYRSMKHQFELVFCQENAENATKLEKMIEGDLLDCEKFNYQKWKSRPWHEKTAEFLLYQFRFFL
jgi:cardiolipin synthase A/B